MTKFNDKSFTVPMGGEKYADNWERTFRGHGAQGDPATSDQSFAFNETTPLKQQLFDFACRECASTVRIITSKPIALKGHVFIRVDIGSSNVPLACPVCRNMFTSEEQLK